jgi:hypothetical protein
MVHARVLAKSCAVRGQTQDALHVAIGLQHIALLLALRGEVSAAARLIGYVNVQ